MLKITPQLLEKRMKDAGWNAAALSAAVGRDKDFIRDFLSGRKKSLKHDDINNIAALLNINMNDDGAANALAEVPIAGLRIEGVAAAGSFNDITLVSDDEHEREIIHVARDPRFPRAHQYALKVSGDSMDMKYPDGSFVTCVAWPDTGMELKDGLPLHIERTIAGNLTEITLKVLAFKNGSKWLEPRSTNPKHQPIEINGDESTEIIVRGLITGKWEPEQF